MSLEFIEKEYVCILKDGTLMVRDALWIAEQVHLSSTRVGAPVIAICEILMVYNGGKLNSESDGDLDIYFGDINKALDKLNIKKRLKR